MHNVVPIRQAMTVEEEFETAFWPKYPRKVSKGTARRAYAVARKKAGVEELMMGLHNFLREIAGKETRYVPHAATWLNGERWLDEAMPEMIPPQEHGPDRVVNGEFVSVWKRRVEAFIRTGFWPAHMWGPEPGKSGTRVPISLAVEGKEEP